MMITYAQYLGVRLIEQFKPPKQKYNPLWHVVFCVFGAIALGLIMYGVMMAPVTLFQPDKLFFNPLPISFLGLHISIWAGVALMLHIISYKKMKNDQPMWLDENFRDEFDAGIEQHLSDEAKKLSSSFETSLLTLLIDKLNLWTQNKKVSQNFEDQLLLDYENGAVKPLTNIYLLKDLGRHIDLQQSSGISPQTINNFTHDIIDKYAAFIILNHYNGNAHINKFQIHLDDLQALFQKQSSEEQLINVSSVLKMYTDIHQDAFGTINKPISDTNNNEVANTNQETQNKELAIKQYYENVTSLLHRMYELQKYNPEWNMGMTDNLLEKSEGEATTPLFQELVKRTTNYELTIQQNIRI